MGGGGLVCCDTDDEDIDIDEDPFELLRLTLTNFLAGATPVSCATSPGFRLAERGSWLSVTVSNFLFGSGVAAILPVSTGLDSRRGEAESLGRGGPPLRVFSFTSLETGF